MEKTVTAAKAVRKFSEILNSVKYRGESFTIVQRGKPVAWISPINPLPKTRTLRKLRDLVQTLPRLGEGADRFGNDLKKIRKHQPCLRRFCMTRE